MENLLAFIEFTQYQQYLKDNTGKFKRAKIMQFPKNIPMSIRLEKGNEEVNYNMITEAKIKAHRIYNKYVSSVGEFEINVSYDSRQKVVNILGDLDLLLNNDKITISELFVIFDDCKLEIWRLLMGSYSRFKQQPEYNDFENEHMNQSLPSFEIVTTDSYKSDVAP